MSADELPPHVRALIDAAQHAPVHADRGAIRARIAGTIAAGAAGTAAAAGGAGKLLMAGAVSVVAAIGGGYVATRSRGVAPSVPVSAIAAPREAVLPPPAPVAQEDAVTVSPAQPTRSSPAHAGERPDETSLLAEAAQAGAHSDPARVLELVAEHARLFPHGALVEERDALELEALLALGRRDDAQSAARRFAANYPHSVHEPLVQRALAQETSR